MKIIQSFAQFDEGSYYVSHEKNYDVIPLLFYSSLFSYITIKKLYGHVTMFCNQKAYDTFVKYIPYDEIILMENKNVFKYWSLYKLDSLRYCNEDAIHIDNDVFLYSNVLTEFIEGNADIIVQDIQSKEDNAVSSQTTNNLDFLKSSGVFTKKFDGRSVSAGVIGIKKHVQDLIFNNIDILKEAIDVGEWSDTVRNGEDLATTILDEQSIYLTAVENDLSIYDILPHDLVIKHGIGETGKIIGYAHMWTKHKYLPENIKDIKRYILFNYTEYQKYIIEYESHVMMQTEIFYELGLGVRL